MTAQLAVLRNLVRVAAPQLHALLSAAEALNLHMGREQATAL